MPIPCMTSSKAPLDSRPVEHAEFSSQKTHQTQNGSLSRSVCASRLPKQKQVRPDSSASSAARFVVSGLSVGAAGSDVFPRSSWVDSREVDVDVYAADDGTQQHQHEQYDESDEHGN